MIIKIFGRKLKIRFIPQEKIGKMTNDDDCLDVIYPHEKKIFISKELPPELKRYYLIHELTHYALFLTGIDQTISLELIESICQTNATLFEDLITK